MGERLGRAVLFVSWFGWTSRLRELFCLFLVAAALSLASPWASGAEDGTRTMEGGAFRDQHDDRRSPSESSGWARLGVAVVALGIAATALFFQIRQLRQAVESNTRSHNFSAATWMIQKLSEDQNVKEARLELHGMVNLRRGRFEELTPKENKTIELVTNTFTRVGLLTHHEMLSTDIVCDMYAEAIYMSWFMVEGWVRYERKRRQYEAFQIFFEHLFDDVTEYMRRHEIEPPPDPWTADAS